MDFNSLFNAFKSRCATINKFTRTKKGRRLSFIAYAVFVLLPLCPLFQGAVGAALIGCVAAPMTVMAWRRHDFHHAVVPAVFFSVPMVLSMLIYGRFRNRNYALLRKSLPQRVLHVPVRILTKPY